MTTDEIADMIIAAKNDDDLLEAYRQLLKIVLFTGSIQLNIFLNMVELRKRSFNAKSETKPEAPSSSEVSQPMA